MTYAINLILFISDLWKSFWGGIQSGLDFIDDIVDIVPGFVHRWVMWIRCNMREYFVRIAFAILWEEYIPDWWYWNTGDYIAEKLTRILPRFLRSHVGYSTEWKDNESYEKDIRELLLLSKKALNDNQDLWKKHFDKKTNQLDKKYYKEIKQREKQYQHLFWKIVPYLWD